MAGASAQISFGEKLADIKKKVGIAASVLGGMLPGGRFQLTSTEVRGATYKVFKNLPDAIGDYYRPFFLQHGDKEWLHYENEVYTFKEALEAYEALGAELRSSLGVNPGDSVGICMRNMPEFVLGFLGASAAGCRAVPLNALWTTTELEYAVKNADCKVLLCDPERLELCLPFARASGIHLVLCKGDQAMADAAGALLWDDVVAAGKGKGRPCLKSVKPEDDAMIMYTSGSTGHPKGVVHTQRSLSTGMKIGELAALVSPDKAPKIVLAVPLFHITALMNVLLHSICFPMEVFMLRKWDAGVCLNIIEKHRVTHFTGVPTMTRDMLEHPDFTPQRVSSMKMFAAGGAPVPPSQVAKLRKATGGTGAVQGYGLTETCGGVIVNHGIDYLKHPTSCGKPTPFIVEVAIIDPATGKHLGDGERGELCIRSAVNLARYHNRPEDTKKAIDKDGFFHSGDVAKCEGGFVYILDRLKDIIIRGGENIDCSEVEAAIYSHPSVRECSVFGLPDERLGEVVGCAIWIQGDTTTAEISQHCASKLAKFKVPHAEDIFFHDEELPKGATGKLDKKGLREKYSASAKPPPMSKL
eukprot:TRINITY_DN60825_c0_g1_i1.p1 TRINITY_DN60825_c0_g1~~TRINITY_DN60825_c0_g1_i1.p1  ORF type:complete len:583 (+),score=108.98 TRINITY_DN60825_c0_g1_i1:89-1837(+)